MIMVLTLAHVDAALDNRCGKEDIVVVGGEVVDDLFELVGRHLAVCHDGARVGYQAAEHGLELV